MISLAPKDILHTLEFDKILERTQDQCHGDPAREYLEQQGFMTDAALIRARLQEVYEFKKVYDQQLLFPLQAYPDIVDLLEYLAVEGYVLPQEGLFAISIQLRIVRDIFRFFQTKKDAKELFPTLYSVIKDHSYDDSLLNDLSKIIDEEGNIRPDASTELTRIRRMMQSKRKELEQVFRRVVNNYASKGWLTDSVESFRNGRRVLTAPAEYKRQIKGIIHDESSSGRTAFIEPEEVIDINNDLFDLEHDEKREIYRILKDISASLRPFEPMLSQYQGIIVRYDVIQAKARMAQQMKADLPEIEDKPSYKLVRAFHPLLFLNHTKEGKKTVPFDLEFRNDNRILLLSGPNAGGKSVCMKAVGLLQLMTQFGMLLPVMEGSKIGVIRKMYADIGDQQSLEDDLSTYSARLRNAKTILEQADEHTLVLIDEFGSGTDPKAGGVIAEAILRDLNHKQVHGVITTHFSNLKVFAFKNKGILNGAMVFNSDTLSPTFELRVGKPGSSYAFEIAKKTGLDGKVIGYAQKRLGEAERNFDELLIELQQEKEAAELAKEQLEARQKHLDHLIKNYEFLQKELETGRKRLKLQAKEQALSETMNSSKEIQKALKELREQENSRQATEKAQALLQEQLQKQQALSQTVEVIKEEIYQQQEAESTEPIGPGTQVKLRDGGALGVIESIEKKEAFVLVGNLRMRMKLRDLIPLKNPIEKPKTAFVSTDMVKQDRFESKLDIRGMSMEDAMGTVEQFVDNALLANVSIIQIVHGKGTGVLRNLVRKKLKMYSHISSVRFAEPHQGGDGVTIAEF